MIIAYKSELIGYLVRYSRVGDYENYQLVLDALPPETRDSFNQIVGLPDHDDLWDAFNAFKDDDPTQLLIKLSEIKNV